MATEEQLEDLMERASHAFDALLDLMCPDGVDVNGQVIPADNAIDLVVVASATDKAALRKQGADNALATLADLLGKRSGIATVSIQLDE